MEQPTTTTRRKEPRNKEEEGMTPTEEPKGDQALSEKDRGNFLLLVILYLLQGIPVGLSFGSIPFLLKSHMSYSQIAVFSLSSWPYSLKLIWSPIVDAVYTPKLGRRKSWIIPIQTLTGILFLWLGSRIDAIMNAEHVPIYYLTFLFLTTIFFCATQDIAVDGWALTLLSKESLSYASTAQTIGLNTGYFLSFTVFLALNSAEFSNKYLRSEPLDTGLVPLGAYMKFWGIMYFVVTAWLAFVTKENDVPSEDDQMGVRGVYETIIKICKLSNVRSFIAVLLVSKIGFICHETVTALKLLEKGFSKEDLALAVLLDFPLQVLFGYYAAKWSNGSRPLKPWLYAFFGRLVCSALGMLVVAGYPKDQEVGPIYFAIIMSSTVLSSFMSTVQFVSISAFMTSIADPVIGGTYMTLLNTFSNFGGTWPKFFVLEAVDYFTVSTCSVPDSLNQVLIVKLFILEFSCGSEDGKAQCKDLGGSCEITQDGYYYAGTMCVIVGLIMLIVYVRPVTKQLEVLSKRKWRLGEK
ncbi:acetyl-coenzyme A transporter 1-domain-containing protein [Phycomyces blakesleeanus]|uniref:Acetyl-coenzyme A transporter 1-domain-containing protein n=1 Tax=Phycomyces blakesleeanus TaxID=4837 RepID=A0ABR3ARP3_PHYBL